MVQVFLKQHLTNVLFDSNFADEGLFFISVRSCLFFPRPSNFVGRSGLLLYLGGRYFVF